MFIVCFNVSLVYIVLVFYALTSVIYLQLMLMFMFSG